MTIEEHISLSQHTTFHVGGEARYFVRVRDERELADAVTFSREKGVPFFVLGGGSNILVSDAGFPGLVIKNEIKGIEYLSEADQTTVVAGAGEVWDDVVAQSVKKNLHGIENLSGIPGSVGAAPVQNIGAYGVELRECFGFLDAYDTTTGTMRKFSRDVCAFTYRNSFFKTAEGKKYIIIRVGLTLSEKKLLNLSYKDIQQYMSAHNKTDLTGQELRVAILSIRGAKLPDWREVGTAGSFFKNPIVEKGTYELLQKRFPDIPMYPATDVTVKIPAAWLLDHIGHFNGTSIGVVGVWKNQALVIVNNGNATAHDINVLADTMAQKILNETGVALEREVESVGAM